MYGQPDPAQLRLQALQESASRVPVPPEKPEWNFHSINRAIAAFELLIVVWMFLTFLARLLPGFAAVYTILAGSLLLACFFAALSNKANLFLLCCISLFGLIIATLLAGWDFLIGIFHHKESLLMQIAVVFLGFGLISAMVHLLMTQSDRKPTPAKVEAPTVQPSGEDQSWNQYLQDWETRRQARRDLIS